MFKGGIRADFNFIFNLQVKPSLAEDNNERCVQVAPTASQIILGFDNFCDFDAVFGEDVSQKELYNTCLVDMVTSFFQGKSHFK